MEKVFAKLDDGRRIALMVPPENKEKFLAHLVSMANGTIGGTPNSVPRIQVQASAVNAKLPRRRSDEGVALVDRICQACPIQAYYKDELGWNRCRECSCVMDHKKLVASATCPKNYWIAEKGD